MAWRKLAALFASALLVVGLAACGDDDDDDETAAAGDDTEETTDTEDGDDAAEDEEAEGDDDHMAEDEEGGPPDVNPCAEGVSPEDAGLPPAEEPAEGATPITVTATEYAFDGLEPLAEGGSFAIEFVNDGAELHELVIQSIDESETRSIEEMMQSEEPPDTVSMMAFGFACPGQSTTLNVELTEPGRYVALCFVPVGTTPETDPATFEDDEAPPHAANGMVLEFTIEA